MLRVLRRLRSDAAACREMWSRLASSALRWSGPVLQSGSGRLHLRCFAESGSDAAVSDSHPVGCRIVTLNGGVKGATTTVQPTADTTAMYHMGMRADPRNDASLWRCRNRIALECRSVRHREPKLVRDFGCPLGRRGRCWRYTQWPQGPIARGTRSIRNARPARLTKLWQPRAVTSCRLRAVAARPGVMAFGICPAPVGWQLHGRNLPGRQANMPAYASVARSDRTTKVLL